MFTNRKRKVPAERKPRTYEHRLSFYIDPPVFDVTLEEFETCALDRLRVLAEIESSMARNRTQDELQSVIGNLCNKHLPLNSSTAIGADLDAERRRDHVSHFVLRLAFCRSEDLRRRFVRAELALFKARYNTDDKNERKAFLDSQDIGWAPLSREEKNELATDLMETVQMSKESFAKEEFRKVHWTKVPDLVEKRRVFISGGYAYVPAREQSSIVFQEYAARLEKALEFTARALPRLDEDTRILPILGHLSQGFLAGVSSEYSGSEDLNGEEIRASMVDELAKKHFPLCMRNMHDHLKREHHLRHFGRLQYGLFLKALGLSLEEAIIFWRQSFSNASDDEFVKKYRYNIRHGYGLEGKRVNYPAKNCQRMLTTDQPGPQDCHGCPYKTFSADNLQAALLSTYGNQGLSSTHMPEIMKAVNGLHYHVACTRVFEITHGLAKGEGIGGGDSVDHPNRYAARSRELSREDEKENKEPKEVAMEID